MIRTTGRSSRAPMTASFAPRLSRRALFRGVGGAALASALPVSLAAPASAAEPAPAPPGFTLLGQAPDAFAVSQHGYAGVIHTLFPYEGRIYYGYGDYNINAGSRSGQHTNVSYVDPARALEPARAPEATSPFGTDLRAYRTEEINTFRSLGGKLFVPNIDPSAGAPGTNSFASNLTGAWAANGGVACIHLDDVCDSSVAGEYFLAGSAHDGARIWRTTDSGVTWSDFFTEPEKAEVVDGFERFYWLARLGDRLYLRANLGSKRTRTAPMRWYDTRTGRWGKVGDAGLKTRWTTSWPGGWSGPLLVGDATVRGSDVVTAQGMAYFVTAGDVYAFNGRRAERLLDQRGALDTRRRRRYSTSRPRYSTSSGLDTLAGARYSTSGPGLDTLAGARYSTNGGG